MVAMEIVPGRRMRWPGPAHRPLPRGCSASPCGVWGRISWFSRCTTLAETARCCFSLIEGSLWFSVSHLPESRSCEMLWLLLCRSFCGVCAELGGISPAGLPVLPEVPVPPEPLPAPFVPRNNKPASSGPAFSTASFLCKCCVFHEIAARCFQTRLLELFCMSKPNLDSSCCLT